MAIGGAILGGAAIGGATSYLGSQSVKDASNDAIRAQEYQYNQTRNDFSPYREGGLNAYNTYQDALGLGGSWQNTPEAYYDWKAANPGKNRREGYQFYLDQFDKGEWTPNEATGPRTPMYNAFNAPPGSELPTYTPGEDLPTYNPTAGPAEYNSLGGFNFNLEDDEIYNFALQEGLDAATKQMNAQKMSNSGGILAELQKRGNLFAADYQDRAHARQLADSRENYGRNVQDYGINDARNRDIYGRNVQDYGINADRNNQMWNRNLTNYGIDTDYANALYGRGVGEYGMGVSRNQDIYGRDQDYLNRLAMQSGGGQNAVAQLGGFGAGAAANIGQLGMAGGAADAQQYQGINNALQGSIANYLTHSLYNNPGGAYVGAPNTLGPNMAGPYTDTYGYGVG